MSDNTIKSCSNPKDFAARGKTALLLWGIPHILIVMGFIVNNYAGIIWGIAFIWAGIGCTINARHCKRVHCYFTGPLYLILGIISLLVYAQVISIEWIYLLIIAIAGTILSFIPEWLGKKYFIKNGQ
ncbi:MAG: hypothetical protein COC01_01455 [Bacteroidetes bacterium]|nr:MAG: hypothetical protein COC01_01455 [Bacteroidota bacterium]